MKKLSLEQSIFLDFLRSIAALMVFFGHALTISDFKVSVIFKLYPIHSLGVVIFLILSGFLITYQFFTKEIYCFEDYFIDRFSRIYVTFIPASILMVACPVLFFPTEYIFSIRLFLMNLLMLGNTPFDQVISWLPTFPLLGSLAVVWTLTLEWWLYMFFGALFVKSRSLVGNIVKLIVFPLSLLVVFYFSITTLYSFAWFFGCIGALIFLKFKPPGKTTLLMLLAIIFYAVIYMSLGSEKPFNFFNVQFVIFSVILFMISIFCVGEFKYIRKFFIFSKKVWKYLAFISYPFYLIHLPFLFGYLYNVGLNSLFDCIMFFTIPIFITIIFSHIFEARFPAVRCMLKRTFWNLRQKRSKIVLQKHFIPKYTM